MLRFDLEKALMNLFSSPALGRASLVGEGAQTRFISYTGIK